MSAASGGIGPVSVRYAQQIRELLHVQAVQRMAADQEAARAQAEAERVEATEKVAEPEPLHARVEKHDEPAPPQPVTQPEPTPPGQLVDIQA